MSNSLAAATAFQKHRAVTNPSEISLAWALLMLRGHVPDDFMLMYYDNSLSAYAFKHTDTRQYTYIQN